MGGKGTLQLYNPRWPSVVFNSSEKGSKGRSGEEEPDSCLKLSWTDVVALSLNFAGVIAVLSMRVTQPYYVTNGDLGASVSLWLGSHVATTNSTTTAFKTFDSQANRALEMMQFSILNIVASLTVRLIVGVQTIVSWREMEPWLRTK
jgi:hypothetical protein